MRCFRAMYSARVTTPWLACRQGACAAPKCWQRGAWTPAQRDPLHRPSPLTAAGVSAWLLPCVSHHGTKPCAFVFVLPPSPPHPHPSSWRNPRAPLSYAGPAAACIYVRDMCTGHAHGILAG